MTQCDTDTTIMASEAVDDLKAAQDPSKTVITVHGEDLDPLDHQPAMADSSPAGGIMDNVVGEVAQKTEPEPFKTIEPVLPAHEDAVEAHSPSEVAFVHADDRFRDAAKLFLGIHREEIAQRETEITKLQTELRRVREGLKALEKTQQESDGRTRDSELFGEQSQKAETGLGTEAFSVQLKPQEPEAACVPIHHLPVCDVWL
jgi:hypothetical protein